MPSIKVQNKYGNTPLHLCAAICAGKEEDQLACLQLLLEYNADKEARNNINKTPAEWAEEMLKDDAVKIVELLQQTHPLHKN
jgi:ankyrin repeat protein